MIRPITTLIAAGLFAFGGASIAKDDDNGQKTNVDYELEMAAEFEARLAAPDSTDALELRRIRESIQEAQSPSEK